MKFNQLAFIIVGLVIAGVALFAALSTWFIVLPDIGSGKRRFFYFLMAVEVVTFLAVGGGGIANLAKGRRLAPWPTGIMILGYCASVWLLPLALWGIISLVLEHKRAQAENAQVKPGLTASGVPCSSL